MTSFEFPPEFVTRSIPVHGATIHVRIGGSGPAVVLLHGYGARANCGRAGARSARIKRAWRVRSWATCGRDR